MENNIKKQWLISFIAITCSTCLGIFYSSNLTGVLTIISLALLGSLTYYLGYLKRDYYWLTFVIVARAVYILISTGSILFLAFSKQLMPLINKMSSTLNFSPVIYLAHWILGTLLSVYYTYWCYQLRLINMKKIDSQKNQKKTA